MGAWLQLAEVEFCGYVNKQLLAKVAHCDEPKSNR
jgi:hypothetical protein